MSGKPVRTVVLSELPKQEKLKYFQFLLENDINFSKDERGNYVALIKVLNPNFNHDVDLQKESLINESLNIKKVESNKENRGNTNLINNSNQGNNSINLISSNKNSVKTNVKSSNSYNNSLNSNLKNVSINKNSNNILNNTNSNINQSSIKKEPTANEILRHLKSTYNNFLNLVQPMVGVRPAKLNLIQLKYFIEEIYSVRFIKDTTTLRNQINFTGNTDSEINDPFPKFVVEFLSNKYTKKHLMDKNCLDILHSSDFFKEKDKEVEIFMKFLTEEYDSEDLIFFLFVRSCIEKELKIMFIEKAKEEIKLQYNEEKGYIDTNLYLNISSCMKIAKTIFGQSDELLLNSFMEKVDQNLVSNEIGKNIITSTKILEFTLEDWHESRRNYDKSYSGKNDPQIKNLGKKLNEETILQKTGFSLGSPSTNTDGKNVTKNIKDDNDISQSDKLNTMKSLTFEYIKERELEDFFGQMLQSYSFEEKDTDYVQNTLLNIKEKVENKLILLINHIFTDSGKDFCDCLRMEYDNSEIQAIYGHLTTLKDDILTYSVEDLPEPLLEEFAQVLLSTNKLKDQINKLIIKNFGN